MTRAESSRCSSPPLNVLRYRALFGSRNLAARTILRKSHQVPVVEFAVRRTSPRTPGGRGQIQSTSSHRNWDGWRQAVDRKAHWLLSTSARTTLRHRYSSTVHESVPPSVMDWLASGPRSSAVPLGSGFPKLIKSINRNSLLYAVRDEQIRQPASVSLTEVPALCSPQLLLPVTSALWIYLSHRCGAAFTASAVVAVHERVLLPGS